MLIKWNRGFRVLLLAVPGLLGPFFNGGPRRGANGW